MPPVAFIVAAISLLVFWAVIVPMLVAIHIQSFSAVVRKVREEERQNLGELKARRLLTHLLLLLLSPFNTVFSRYF